MRVSYVARSYVSMNHSARRKVVQSASNFVAVRQQQRRVDHFGVHITHVSEQISCIDTAKNARWREEREISVCFMAPLITFPPITMKVTATCNTCMCADTVLAVLEHQKCREVARHGDNTKK